MAVATDQQTLMVQEMVQPIQMESNSARLIWTAAAMVLPIVMIPELTTTIGPRWPREEGQETSLL